MKNLMLSLALFLAPLAHADRSFSLVECEAAGAQVELKMGANGFALLDIHLNGQRGVFSVAPGNVDPDMNITKLNMTTGLARGILVAAGSVDPIDTSDAIAEAIFSADPGSMQLNSARTSGQFNAVLSVRQSDGTKVLPVFLSCTLSRGQ